MKNQKKAIQKIASLMRHDLKKVPGTLDGFHPVEGVGAGAALNADDVT